MHLTAAPRYHRRQPACTRPSSARGLIASALLAARRPAHRRQSPRPSPLQRTPLYLSTLNSTFILLLAARLVGRGLHGLLQRGQVERLHVLLEAL
jgi:hypothetical protein